MSDEIKNQEQLVEALTERGVKNPELVAKTLADAAHFERDTRRLLHAADEDPAKLTALAEKYQQTAEGLKATPEPMMAERVREQLQDIKRDVADLAIEGMIYEKDAPTKVADIENVDDLAMALSARGVKNPVLVAEEFTNADNFKEGAQKLLGASKTNPAALTDLAEQKLVASRQLKGISEPGQREELAGKINAINGGVDNLAMGIDRSPSAAQNPNPLTMESIFENLPTRDQLIESYKGYVADHGSVPAGAQAPRPELGALELRNAYIKVITSSDDLTVGGNIDLREYGRKVDALFAQAGGNPEKYADLSLKLFEETRKEALGIKEEPAPQPAADPAPPVQEQDKVTPEAPVEDAAAKVASHDELKSMYQELIDKGQLKQYAAGMVALTKFTDSIFGNKYAEKLAKVYEEGGNDADKLAKLTQDFAAEVRKNTEEAEAKNDKAAPAEPKKEEPKAEEPKAEEPKAEEPKAEAPKEQGKKPPVVEDPKAKDAEKDKDAAALNPFQQFMQEEGIDLKGGNPFEMLMAMLKVFTKPGALEKLMKNMSEQAEQKKSLDDIKQKMDAIHAKSDARTEKLKEMDTKVEGAEKALDDLKKAESPDAEKIAEAQQKLDGLKEEQTKMIADDVALDLEENKQLQELAEQSGGEIEIKAEVKPLEQDKPAADSSTVRPEPLGTNDPSLIRPEPVGKDNPGGVRPEPLGKNDASGVRPEPLGSYDPSSIRPEPLGKSDTAVVNQELGAAKQTITAVDNSANGATPVVDLENGNTTIDGKPVTERFNQDLANPDPAKVTNVEPKTDPDAAKPQEPEKQQEPEQEVALAGLGR